MDKKPAMMIEEVELVRLHLYKEQLAKLDAQAKNIALQQIIAQRANADFVAFLYKQYDLPKTAKISTEDGTIQYPAQPSSDPA